MTASNPDFKRYNIAIDKYDHPVPYETEHGQWVKYSSYKALQAECEKLRKDAARYQWLKHLAIKGSYDRDWEFPLVDAWEYRPGSEANVEYETLDAAIDAAMEGGNEPC